MIDRKRVLSQPVDTGPPGQAVRGPQTRQGQNQNDVADLEVGEKLPTVLTGSRRVPKPPSGTAASECNSHPSVAPANRRGTRSEAKPSGARRARRLSAAATPPRQTLLWRRRRRTRATPACVRTTHKPKDPKR